MTTTPRKYTGTTEGVGGGPRAGLEFFADSVEYLSGGRMWNNGTYGIRPVRSGSALSVHATGRAVDLSRRNMNDGRRIGQSRKDALAFIDALIKIEGDADGILELVIDYDYNGTSRVWKCDRAAWRTQPLGAIAGAPGGDWFHIELSPAGADSVARVQKFWAELFAGL